MDFRKLVMYRNFNNPFYRLLCIKITDIREGYAEARMDIEEKHLNQIQSVHGGCIFTLADSVGGAAAVSYGYAAATVNGDIQYLNAAMNTSCLRGTAKVVKRGKRIIVVSVDIYDQDEKHIATGLFSFTSIGKPLNLEELPEE